MPPYLFLFTQYKLAEDTIITIATMYMREVANVFQFFCP